MVSKKLGTGLHSDVYEALFEQDSDQIFAIKVFNREAILHKELIQCEFDILKKLEGHENVMKAFEYVKESGKIKIPRCIPVNDFDVFASYRTGYDLKENASYMTMEICKKDLFSFICINGPISDQPLAKYLLR